MILTNKSITEHKHDIYTSIHTHLILKSNILKSALQQEQEHINNITAIKSYLAIMNEQEQEKPLKVIQQEQDIIIKIRESIKDIPINSIELEQDYYRYIKSIEFDLKNNSCFKVSIIQKPLKIAYKQDMNDYSYINKQTRLKDLSIFSILRVLYNSGHLNKQDYKESIAREQENKKFRTAREHIKKHFKNNFNIPLYHIVLSYNQKIKPLRARVLKFVNCYFNTIKSHNNKNTITAKKRQQDKREFNIFKYNNNSYKVFLKKNYSYYFNKYTQIIEQEQNIVTDFYRAYHNNVLTIEQATTRLKRLLDITEQEFIIRIKASNQIEHN
jgi:hypothetical protein